MAKKEFKYRKEYGKKRNIDIRKPNISAHLIITEGKATEPLYFEGLKRKILAQVGGIIDIKSVPQIDIAGIGSGTVKLVEEAEKIVNRSHVIYNSVWVVFDKDDFIDFDIAVRTAKQKGYHVAWSNQSFEFWLYLHFNYTDSDLHRNVINEKLNTIFKEKGLNKGIYEKNIPDIFELVTKDGGLEIAVSNAEKLMKKYDVYNTLPSNCNPGTTVHFLIRAFEEFL